MRIRTCWVDYSDNGMELMPNVVAAWDAAAADGNPEGWAAAHDAAVKEAGHPDRFRRAEIVVARGEVAEAFADGRTPEQVADTLDDTPARNRFGKPDVRVMTLWTRHQEDSDDVYTLVDAADEYLHEENPDRWRVDASRAAAQPGDYAALVVNVPQDAVLSMFRDVPVLDGRVVAPDTEQPSV